jgi:NodT family efflux transporter outer membrane factor (OMF) lipoprotein
MDNSVKKRLLAVLIPVLCSCTVGPNFVPPAPPKTTHYLPATSKLKLTPKDEPPQHIVDSQNMPADWWKVFKSPLLNTVVREAIDDSPSLDAAKATLAQAQQAVLQARGGYYPQIDVAASAERQRGPTIALGLQPNRSLPVFNLYSLGPTVSFAPDVFGLTARRVEQQEALSDVQKYQLAAAYLAITGNAVTQAITIASLRQQIGVVKKIIAEDEKNLALVQKRVADGGDAHIDALTAEKRLESDRSLLPSLGQQRAVAEDTLAILVGKSPAEWTVPSFDLTDLTLPPELPLSIPSSLVHLRPDILAAEARLHADSAAIGVATAQMYPNFPLSASIDTSALSATSLFEQSSLIWTLAGGLTAPIFHGGALEAQKKEAIEGFHASLATYRLTVLQAFGQVADILRSLGHDADMIDVAKHTLDDANEALNLQRVSYAVGKTDMLKLVDAERSAQQAHLSYVRAQAQRYLDSAQLMVSMGGSWEKAAFPCSDHCDNLMFSGL